MYADFSYYVGAYFGKLTETEFNRLSVRAVAEIDRLTFGRASTATGASAVSVKMAQCAVVDELAYMEQGGEITSESNDGVSRSYAAGVARSKSQRIADAARVYLANTNLCFAGV